jgi:thiamine biosynthesis lipoprotein
VRVDSALSLVGVPRGRELDLGATAKAWTADHAAQALHEALREPVLVELGGDLAAAGAPEGGWLVEVTEGQGATGQVVVLSGGGLATSSTTVRRWQVNGHESHHVIDPATGHPTHGPWRTASVWAPSALEANACSTAVLVLGDKAATWLEARGRQARLVGGTGEVRLVGGWPSDRSAPATPSVARGAV